MKRSEINSIIRDAKAFIDHHQFRLPPWAYWGPEQWRGKAEVVDEIVENMLGWDITDFGGDNFGRVGLFLFTIRNGNISKPGSKPYAEKLLIADEGQETPLHFHWKKTEDIINRGGGNLVAELFWADENDGLADRPIEVRLDGIRRTFMPGERVILTPGESITLPTRLYHRFYGEPGKGRVLIGEVSMCNDDNTDNRFYEPVGRFPSIEEDEPPVHLLVNDYKQFL